jgi:hypothetical protein
MKRTSLLSLLSFAFALVVLNFSIVMAEPPGGLVDSSCDSGGPGSSSCTVKYGIGIGGGGASGSGDIECSVTCGKGYACCAISTSFPYVTCKCKGVTSSTNGGSAN